MCCFAICKFTVHYIVYRKLLSLTSYKFTNVYSLQQIATDQSVSYRIAGNFRRSKISRKSRFPSRRNFHFRVQRELLTTPLYRRRANRGRKMSRGKGQDVVYQFEIALWCHRQMSYRARLIHKMHGVKISKSSRVQIFTVLYFAVLIIAFWSWVAKIVKIWTLQKFPAIQYYTLHGFVAFVVFVQSAFLPVQLQK